MNKKIFWIAAVLLAWFGRDGARAQQRQPVTSTQPDCMVNFSLPVASSGAQATAWLPGVSPPPIGSVGTSLVIDNHQAGCYGWTVFVDPHNLAALSLAFQSAPDNAAGTAPGTWATVAVCGGTECLGINPNTGLTPAITTTKKADSWFRVNLTSKTGAGAVVGVLYGWKVNITANGGGPAPPVSTCPGGLDTQLQYNNLGACAGVVGSAARADGSVEIAPNLSTPEGGIGTYQNFMGSSSVFTTGATVGTWVPTNVTVSTDGIVSPNGPGTINDVYARLRSTVANGKLQQCFDTGTAMTGRTFTASVWALVKTTPVTSRLTILSETPSTAGTQTFAITTTGKRFFLTATFGADAGTQVCLAITPVNGGTGDLNVWGAQLEESASPSPYTDTYDNLPFITRAFGFYLGNVTAKHLAYSLGGNTLERSASQASDSFQIGLINDCNSQQCFEIGTSNVVTGAPGYAFGSALKESAAASMGIGFGFSAAFPLENDVANSECLGAVASGLASTGHCSLLISPATGANGVVPGPPIFGSLSFATLPASTGGGQIYCSDCTVTSGIDNTCAGTGSGAMAERINGAWKCII